MNVQKKRRLKRAIWGCAVVAPLFVAASWLPFAKHLEQLTLDIRYKYFNRENKVPENVVVIDIDEQSLNTLGPVYGRWPWPRRVHKDLIEFLAMGEPTAILFDVRFTESMLGTDDDALLGEASQSVGMVSHAADFLTESSQETDKPLPLPPDFAERFALKFKGQAHPTQTALYKDFQTPAKDIYPLTPNIHLVTYGVDPDGVYRRGPMTLQYGEHLFPSLALQGVLSTFKDPELTVVGNSLRIDDKSGKNLTVPLDENGKFPLHFYKKDPDAIPYAAAIDSSLRLQRGEVTDPSQLKVNPFELKGKIILIGASAAGLEDLKITPINEAYPGVRLHTIAIENILSQDFLTPLAPYWKFLLTLALVVFTYTCVLLNPNLWVRTLAPFVAIGGTIATAIYLFQEQSIWVPIAIPVLAATAALFDGFAYISFVENQEKKKLTSTLTKYLSPTVTEALIATGSDPQAEVGRTEELSIMFSDIRGFTTLSERLKPEVLVARLNEYLEKMTGVIFDYTGTLDKFIGDCVMAFWGAPLKDPHHAIKAVRCAFAMQNALEVLKDEWARKLGSPFQIATGIGINTGEVIVGNIGSEKRLDYTVIGDNVNLASRVEGLTKQYNTTFLVGEKTYEIVNKSITCRIIDAVKVKGKTHCVRIYEPLAEVGTERNLEVVKLVERFAEAWDHYQKGAFGKALELFVLLNQSRQGGDGPSQVYIERCKHLLEEAPKDWDGVYVAKSK